MYTVVYRMFNPTLSIHSKQCPVMQQKCIAPIKSTKLFTLEVYKAEGKNLLI